MHFNNANHASLLPFSFLALQSLAYPLFDFFILHQLWFTTGCVVMKTGINITIHQSLNCWSLLKIHYNLGLSKKQPVKSNL